VLVTTAAAWIAVSRALRPVSTITSLAAGVDASDLSRRVPVPDTDDEIAELASTVNAMLDRIEAGRIAQRRFTSDAAHELRTPLMALQGEIELARRAPADGPVDPRLLERLDVQCRRLSARVDDLVLLSTLDEHPPLHASPLDLVTLVRDEASPSVMVQGDEVIVACDARLVRRAVRNLLANATRYALERVEVVVSAVDDRVWIHVDDDGPGIAPDDRERVLGRFGRLEEARGADSGGSGLGLAIVVSVAEAHGGGVVVDTAPLGGARVSLWLPR
jgi:signal transduction histidine kinase